MKTLVVNLKLGADYDVYIGRAGPWMPAGADPYFGNPFHVSPGQPRGATIARFKEWFYKRLSTDPIYRARIETLRGKKLGCFCAPLPCHGDIIAAYLNGVQ